MNLFTKQSYRYQKQTYSYWRGNMGWRADKLGDWSWHIHTVCVCAQSLQSCPTLCDLKDCSPPGCSVHEILQARILEWVAMPSSRGSSWPNDWTHVSCISCIADRFFTTEPPRCSTCTLLYTKLGFPSGSAVENLPAMQETWVESLGWEDFLEREMNTHCSILAWEIPWTKEPGRLQLKGLKKSWTWLSD